MKEVLYISVGLIALIFLVWLISEIQIKVWLHRIDNHFSAKYHKLKTEKDEKTKE